MQISVEADAESVDDLAVMLGRYCVGGAVVELRMAEAHESSGDRATVKGFLPAWDQETCRKLEIALLLLGQTSAMSAPRICVLEPRDWSESWKEFFPPQHIGARTVIVPTWHEYRPDPGEVVIHLDPGMAFGTGLHATTRLCLMAVERLLRPGMVVLDVGTGSGILAIAAALQGARAVTALDTDPVAVKVARDNVALNRVEAIVQVDQGSLDADWLGRMRPGRDECDMLLINILAETIIDLAPAMARAMRSGGIFCASGVLSAKADMVACALAGERLVVDERLEEDDWVALVGRKA
ncbi:MAG TPA: 50S ribosomal protein L11 methyltransferase [Anaerolineae bacterium]|nr:50S ribosomal protein L11 methyltransferase [Anaerolineae bacterium]